MIRHAITQIMEELQHGCVQGSYPEELFRAMSFLRQTAVENPEQVRAVLDLFAGGDLPEPPDEMRTRRCPSSNEFSSRGGGARWTEVYVFDADSLHYLEANDQALAHLQLSADQLRRLTPLDICPVMSRPEMEELLEPLRTGLLPAIRLETLHRRSDGSTYRVEIDLRPGWVEESPVFIARGKTAPFLALRRPTGSTLADDRPLG